MSKTVSFDSHGCVKQLEKIGFEEKQAEGMVTVMVEIVNANAARKQDSVELEMRMTVRMILINLAVAGLILAFG